MGGVGPISSVAILHLCEVYDATIEDFEKVLMLEGLLYKAEDKPEEQPKAAKKPAKKRGKK